MNAAPSRLAGGAVLRPQGPVPGDLTMHGGRVAADRRGAEEKVLDVTGLLVAPGLIDLQCNGGHGVDLATEPGRLWELGAALPRYGVTAFLPTIVTSPPDVVDRALDVLRAGPPPGWRGATPLGLHVEGPMLNPVRRGAHARDLLRAPDVELIGRWTRVNGVALVTLAPELPGALDVVRRLAHAGVVVAAGHTDATAEQFIAGIDAGIRYATHLYNAMSPLAHRAPGAVGATLADPRITAGLIVDGIHVHPTAVAGAWQALGPDRLTLVTDAIAALGLAPGAARLGTMDVTVGADGVRLADGTLAGANLSLDEAVRNLVAWTGCSITDAMATVTSTPARVLGLDDRGMLDVGRRADAVVLTPELDVVATITGGELVWAREGVAWRS
ncbi:MAG TPA: N-acetylglucosamine-6-phosphate deacetylase [Acidimicrobiales bacterium]|nr:N-acetylglucosamine-6-phosphate deacetylase [Acidimicrobiales bacterium]